MIQSMFATLGCYHRLQSIHFAWFLSLAMIVPNLAVAQKVEPATAIQAAAAIDLSKFEMVDPEGPPSVQTVASQSYQTKGKIVDVAKKVQALLKKAGCQELEGATFTNDYASATYTIKGFTLSLMVTAGAMPDTCMVMITNHGNVDLKSIPVVKDAKQLYALPSTISYVTEMKLPEALEASKKLLADQDWVPFGDTTVSFFMKRNAIVLQVMVTEAPAQGNKTAIQISSEQISVDLPAPDYKTYLQFRDGVGGMQFDSEQTVEEIFAYFQETLGELGWKSTTEQAVQVNFTKNMIFRNDKKEYIEVEVRDVEGTRTVSLKYMTAKEFAEMEKRADVAIAKKKEEAKAKMERKKNPPKIAVSTPSGASVSERKPQSIEFSIKSGGAKAALTSWLKPLTEDGWKVEKTVDSKDVGDYTLSKDDQQIHVSFVDPGFIPGEITISVSDDFQLDLKESK